MNIEAEVTINGSKEDIWNVITDIENAEANISAIEKVEILNKPDDDLVGLKWRETRTMFGKTATEEMWITESVPNEYYQTRAESHGCLYVSKLSIAELDGDCILTMGFTGKAQSFLAKMMMVPMGLLFKGATKKMLLQDLNDIKAAVEKNNGDAQSASA